MNFEFLRTNRSLAIITPDRNTAHSPVIARDRDAGGLCTPSVGCAHPTLLAEKWAASVVACCNTSVLRNSRHVVYAVVKNECLSPGASNYVG